MIDEPVSPGKQVLLRALDNITDIESDTGGSVEYLAVIYAVISTDQDGDAITTRGWDATNHPAFVLSGLLDEVATRMRHDAVIPDEDEDE